MFRLARIHEAVSVLVALTAVTLTAFYQQSLDLFAVPDRGDPLFSICWYGLPSTLYELDPVSSMPEPASGRWAAR